MPTRIAEKLAIGLAAVDCWPTERDCLAQLSDFAAYHLSHGLGLLDALIGSCAVGRPADYSTLLMLSITAAVPGLVVVQPYTR